MLVSFLLLFSLRYLYFSMLGLVCQRFLQPGSLVASHVDLLRPPSRNVFVGG